jgi:hypothetical protein
MPTAAVKDIYTSPTASVTWTKPTNFSGTTITIKAWGGGGGGANGPDGGGAGFVKGDLNVSAISTLDVRVGGGGGGSTSEAAAGGGYSAVFNGGTPIVVAGGGGGAGGNASGGAGGVGGGTTGGAGGAVPVEPEPLRPQMVRRVRRSRVGLVATATQRARKGVVLRTVAPMVARRGALPVAQMAAAAACRATAVPTEAAAA